MENSKEIHRIERINRVNQKKVMRSQLKEINDLKIDSTCNLQEVDNCLNKEYHSL